MYVCIYIYSIVFIVCFSTKSPSFIFIQIRSIFRLQRRYRLQHTFR